MSNKKDSRPCQKGFELDCNDCPYEGSCEYNE